MHKFESRDPATFSQALLFYCWSADLQMGNGCAAHSSLHYQFPSIAYHKDLLTQDRFVKVPQMFMFMFSNCWLLQFSQPEFFGLQTPTGFANMHLPTATWNAIYDREINCLICCLQTNNSKCYCSSSVCKNNIRDGWSSVLFIYLFIFFFLQVMILFIHNMQSNIAP